MKAKGITNIFLAALFVLSPALLSCQEGEVYVSISAGVSIPLLDYAKSDFDNDSSGFARTGAGLKVMPR
ncbi:MAG: hypothetical protein RQ761_00605 [Bacteroidales bacterium]|nr:hypothetical protein [Bacteroidales bacterium]